LSEKQAAGLATHFRDMKALFDSVIKEAQDVNQASQDLTLQVKQECLGEVNDIRAKMTELEKMQSDVKRIEENINDELVRISDDHQTQKRANFNQTMELKERIQRMDEALKNKHERSMTDITYMKNQLLTLDKDFR